MTHSDSSGAGAASSGRRGALAGPRLDSRPARVCGPTGALISGWGSCSGASLKDVQEILGHADYKMIQRYAHLCPSPLRAAVDRLDGLTRSTTPAQTAVQSPRLVSPHAPVAQVDRAAVS